jgi:hypothetical protein
MSMEKVFPPCTHSPPSPSYEEDHVLLAVNVMVPRLEPSPIQS